MKTRYTVTVEFGSDVYRERRTSRRMAETPAQASEIVLGTFQCEERPEVVECRKSFKYEEGLR